MTTKLLAVDDSKTMRRVLEITFSGDEFQTTIASGVEQAMAAVKAAPPQVAVVDAHLGAESGYDLCRSIKAAAPGTRVLILSSKQRPYDESKGQSVGADGHFDKPFDSTKMIAKVNEQAASAGPVAAAPTAGVAPAPVRHAPAAQVAAPAKSAPAMPNAGRNSPGLSSRGAESTGRRPVAPIGGAPAARPQTSLSGAASAASPGRPMAPKAPAAQASGASTAASLSTGSSSARSASSGAASIPADLESKLQNLGLTAEQVQGVLALSKEVVEQVVWEVVPVLAETMIKEEIARLTAE